MSEYRTLRSNLRKRLRANTNPLEIDLILETIFSYCSGNDLKAARLVCPDWCRNSQSVWKKKAVARVTDAQYEWDPSISIDDLERHISTSSSTKLFLNLNWRHEQLPLASKYPSIFQSLQYLELSECVLNGSAGLLHLLQNVPSLKTLKLSDLELTPTVSSISTETVASNWVHPNLQTFELSMKYIVQYQCEELKPFLITLLPILSNLLELRLASRIPLHTCLFNEAVLDLAETQQLPKIAKLNVLDLCLADYFAKGFLKCFKNTLKEIAIHLNMSGLDCIVDSKAETILRRFTVAASSRLEGTERDEFLMNGAQVRFPVLEELSLEMGKFTGFSFLESVATPNLKRLEFRDNDVLSAMDAHTRRAQGVRLCHQNLHLASVTVLKLHLDAGDYLCKEELHLFAKAMPQLEEMELHLTNLAFPVVCKCWKGLRILRVLGLKKSVWQKGGAVDDKAVTGQPEKVMMKREDNITNLQSLTHFSVGMSEERVDLTDVSVTEGFMKMKSLYSLEFCMDKISFKVRKELENRVPVLREVRDST